jgi:pSer/pThr/pTyr-binding forkhead associated (FHA) protein
MRLLKIGRDGSCDIVLHSDKASSLHAEITLLNNGDILLEDKNSRNGTFVMNHPIKPGTQVNIKRGDAIRFGDVELLWEQIPAPDDNSNYKAVYGIGSNFRNDIQISGNTVSRFHATLKIDKKGKVFLFDHSKNGTTVNGQRINPGKPHRLKRSDAVVCGGVPVNVAQFIPNKSVYKVLAVAASIIILFGIGYYTYPYIISDSNNNPSTTQALENASACVYGGFYYEVTIDDDPFKTILDNWPKKWYVSYVVVNKEKVWNVGSSTDGLSPIEYNGTAFFISKEGEMGTNRHVAAPWEYRTDKDEEAIRQIIEQSVQQGMLNSNGYLYQILIANMLAGNETVIKNVDAWIARYRKSPISISGSHAYFGIGLTGSKIKSVIDLQQAQIIAESGDPKKDVALIRLNSRKTPDYIVKMGAIYDLSFARVDESSLKPQEDELTIIGYPLGERVSDESFDGKELRPTIHKTTISKVPDDNQIQIQTVGIGGQSGSPVCDKKHRLVGVLCSGFDNTEVTFCCNIKHLVELYDKNKVRE